MTELLIDSRPELDDEWLQLTEDDLVWLEKLANRELNDDDLTAANRQLATGAKHLTDDIDPDTFNSVMKARQTFYEDLLGWDNEGHQLHRAYERFRSYHERLMPLDTAIETMRTYEGLGLDAAKVINALPAALGLNSDSVRAKVTVLTELGLDAAKVINGQPTVLGLNSDSVRDKFAVLKELGLDAAKVINGQPTALGYNSDSIRIKFSLLQRYGYYDASREKRLLPSNSTISYLLILPNETLALFLASRSDNLPALDRLKAELETFRESNETLHTATGRSELYRDCYPELRKLVGCLAVRQARRNKVDTWSHLKGEMIAPESLHSRPANHALIA